MPISRETGLISRQPLPPGEVSPAHYLSRARLVLKWSVEGDLVRRVMAGISVGYTRWRAVGICDRRLDRS